MLLLLILGLIEILILTAILQLLLLFRLVLRMELLLFEQGVLPVQRAVGREVDGVGRRLLRHFGVGHPHVGNVRVQRRVHHQLHRGDHTVRLGPVLDHLPRCKPLRC